MRRGWWISLTFLICFQFPEHALFSQTASLRGQASGWITSQPEKSAISQLGFRYIPNMFIDKTITGSWHSDAEIAVNAYGTLSLNHWKKTDSDGKIKPYRLWGRFSTNQFELRVGLQKINFGSAVLLRPLMWFDRIDPRDPLQLTDGVYAVLARYYFLNNTNVWLWGLYGNEDVKGLESFPTARNTAEFGGRFQMPVPRGEAALTYHHRQGSFQDARLMLFPAGDTRFPENRFAFDAKVDVGIGLWVEAVLIHRQTTPDFLKYQRLWTIGGDYTFAVGNGLAAIFEHFTTESSAKMLGSGNRSRFSALSLSYALGLVDNVSSIIYYDWKNRDWYRLLDWNRQYDNWGFYLLAFWNPQAIQLYQTTAGNNPFAGKGVQLMVVFNH